MENMFRLSNGQATTKRLKTDDEAYKANANDCLTLHLINNTVQSSSWPPRPVASFKPDFTHQIFGDDEQILGYKDLAIDIYFSQQDFRACVEISYTDKLHKAVDIFKTLKEHFPAGLSDNKKQFMSEVSSKGTATTLSKSSLGKGLSVPGLKSGLSIVQAILAQGSQQLRDLHARMQPFLLFFIDGASFIDEDDAKWEFLLAVEERAGQDVVVGFCTLYTFFNCPDRKRFRLSQIFVLPPYQRHGIGAALLKAAYALAAECNAVDVTFEDPTESLQTLRDLVDLQRATDCGWLQAAAEQVANKLQNAVPATSEAAQQPAAGPQTASIPNKVLADAQKELHISQQQARRIWEAMLYAQPKIRTDAGLATLALLVRKRIEGNSASVKKQAEKKRVFDVPHHGFVMRKCKGKMPLTPGNGIPVAMENDEQSPEEAEQALTEALTTRIADLDAQLAKLGVLRK